MKRIFLAAGSAAALAMTLAACGDNADTADTTAESTEEVLAEGQQEPPESADIDLPAADADPAARNLAEAEAFLQANAQRAEVMLTASGLQYEELEAGPEGGASPGQDDWACVNYTGALIDGTVFDSTEGGLPLILPLAGIIEGWREALPLMSEGDHWTLYIPPALGYGPLGASNVIPPNAALVFDLSLLRVVQQSEIAVLEDRRVDPDWNCAEPMAAEE